MALQNNFFSFDSKIYNQTDGVAMGLPLGPSLAIAFLCFHEQMWLNKRKNVFPIKLVDNCIKTFLHKKFLHTPIGLTVEKKELFIALPYLGNLSPAIRTYLQNSINKYIPFCKI